MTSLDRESPARQLAATVAVEVLVLAAVGPGPVGWAAGLAFVLVLRHVLLGAARRAGAETLGPAGLVTLLRAVLIGGITALVADGLATGTTPVAVLVGLAAPALALDAVDGRVARRTATASPLGARFDMETDAALLMVLSVQAALLLGPWVLAIGLMRYAFVVASWVVPWLSGTLPPRFSAKAVAALQGIVLVVAVSGILTLPVAASLVAIALVLLVWSFAYDVPRLREAARSAELELAA